MPVIKTRKTRTLRRKDGLIKFAHNNTSQCGEDGILKVLFSLIGDNSETGSLRENTTSSAQATLAEHASDQSVVARVALNMEEDDSSEEEEDSNNKSIEITPLPKWVVDVGAWDGKHLSNTYSLFFNEDGTSRNDGWRGLFIEAVSERLQELKLLHNSSKNICLDIEVKCEVESKASLQNILNNHSPPLPKRFELLIIDVDGPDYWLWKNLLEAGEFRAKIVVIEFNPTMPDSLIYIQDRSDNVRHGSSLAAITELANTHNYTLVETTLYNAIFVETKIYASCLKLQELVPDTSIEALHETTMGTQMYQLYDGTLKLQGCKKLLWHRIPIKEDNIQVLHTKQRSFPFAPSAAKTKTKAKKRKNKKTNDASSSIKTK
eukprot:g4009.t1